jgi:arsenate reductase (thioredoxin)
MAEGFARAYGSDVLTAESAGLTPAMAVAPLTHKVMLEKNIDLGHKYPRSLDSLTGRFDLVINMSGQPVPQEIQAAAERWDIPDPIGESEKVYRQVRDQIEQRVMRLVLGMRSRKPPQSEESSASSASRVDSHRQPPRK